MMRATLAMLSIGMFLLVTACLKSIFMQYILILIITRIANKYTDEKRHLLLGTTYCGTDTRYS